jgi:hypothetical protein
MGRRYGSTSLESLDIVRRAVQLVGETDDVVTAAGVADRLGVHPRTLTRFIQREGYATVGAFLVADRIVVVSVSDNAPRRIAA